MAFIGIDERELKMPIATRVGVPTKRFELKSLEGGFVVLRRMTFGEKMQRKALLAKPKMEIKGGRARNQDISAELEFLNRKVTEFEFATVIVEHNLTYLANPDDSASESLLNFKDPKHLEMLDGLVGDEIDEYITTFNDFEGDEGVGKSSTSSGASS
jgi:hypothetical protein